MATTQYSPTAYVTTPSELDIPASDMAYSINVNDPGLIQVVNKLQDVFATVGVRANPTGSPVAILTYRRSKTPSICPRLLSSAHSPAESPPC
jgi:hypothetical protein